jgi:alcohol dehydrogenase
MPGPIKVKIPETIIGLGAISKIGDIAGSFAARKILVLTDAGIVKAGILDALRAPLEKAGLKFEVFDGCQEEPPVSLVEEISKKVREGNYDLLIGIGGGSAMDTTKVASVTALTGMSVRDYLNTGFHDKIEGKIIPKILVPTTAGTGSEWSIVTPVYDHEGGRIHIGQAWENIPDRVIIDPELAAKMPQRLTADTGMDALAHAIEAYASPNANVISDMLSSTALKMISENLRQAYAKGKQNIEARYHMSIAAALAMNSAISAGIGLSHIINHHLGPRAHVSHGTAVSLTLPAVMEYNLVSNPARFARIAELMGENISGLSTLEAAAKSVEAVRRLMKDLNLPQKMSDVGIREADIPELARRCCELDQQLIDSLNPRDATEEDVARILRASL